MQLACPICHKVSSVTLHCQLTTQPEIFKLHCFDCNQLVYKCELCYKFQRSTLNNDALIRNNGKKFRRASCYSIIFQNEFWWSEENSTQSPSPCPSLTLFYRILWRILQMKQNSRYIRQWSHGSTVQLQSPRKKVEMQLSSWLWHAI